MLSLWVGALPPEGKGRWQEAGHLRSGWAEGVRQHAYPILGWELELML